jgi:hypothetical protein
LSISQALQNDFFELLKSKAEFQFMSDATDLARCEVFVLSGFRQDFGIMPNQKAGDAHFVISQIMSKDFKVMRIS